MKKIVGTIAAIALATSAVFADVNVGMGFSRGIFTPIAYDGKDARMDISTSWGAQPRIGGSISGASEDCGVVGDFKFDGGNLAVNDNAYIWVKPISWLKINIGQSFDDTLRGNACFGTWDWLRINGALTGEDFIFTRIAGNPLEGAWAPLVGAILTADPIEGLHFGVSFPIYGSKAGWGDWDNNPDTPDTWTDDPTKDASGAYKNSKFEDVFAKMQVQAGYTIDGVGQIKAQWIGGGKNYVKKAGDDPIVWGQIEAAFCLKAVENMTLDIGAKFRTKEKSPIDVAAYWSMPFDALRVHASVGLTLDPQTKVGNLTFDESLTTIVAGAGIDYDLGNGLGISADVRFGKAFSSLDGFESDPVIGFGVWVNKGIANGTIGIGAQGATKTTIRDFKGKDTDVEDAFQFAVPVRVQCFF